MFEGIKNMVVSAVIIWALIFGVNVGGKHYGLDFSTNGVSIVWGR